MELLFLLVSILAATWLALVLDLDLFTVFCLLGIGWLFGYLFGIEGKPPVPLFLYGCLAMVAWMISIAWRKRSKIREWVEGL